MVSPLNPEAPDYLPRHNHKLQQQQQQVLQPQPLPCSTFPPTSIYTPHCNFLLLFSSFPSRHPYNPFYYPTLTLSPSPPSSIPLALEADQPTRFHEIKNGSDSDSNSNSNSNPVEAHAVNKKDQLVVAEEPKTGCGSIGFVKKQAFKAYINGGCSESWRQKSYPPRRKVEVNGQRKNVDFLRNRKVFRHHPANEPFRGFPKRNRFNPSLPVRDGETTVMIKNIPSKYTRELLVNFLEDHCLKVNRTTDNDACKEKGEEESIGLAFDFLYLPIDFKTRMNKGYAFVNFTNPQAAQKFCNTASRLKWDMFQSNKIREVVSARLQGKEQLEKHFETMNFPCDSEDVLPVSFTPPRDGVNKGDQRTMGNLLKRQHV